MSKAPLSYKQKLDLIKSYTDLGFPKRKLRQKNPDFTKTEKWLISRYYNIAKESGYFGEQDGELIPKVKYVRGKTGQQKGSPRFKGRFVKGAKPSDKMRGDKIITPNYNKIQIPMDFNDLDISPDDDEFDEIIYEIIFDALTPYYEDLKKGDYFTIYLVNGWEVGRGQSTKWSEKDGQPIARDLSGEDKFHNLAEKIIELIRRGYENYKMKKLALVGGVYLWQFKKQRKPTAKEKAVISGKKKRKRK